MPRCGDEADGRVCILTDDKHLAHTDGQAWWDNAPAREAFERRPKAVTKGRNRTKVSRSAQQQIHEARSRTRSEDGQPGVERTTWTREAWLTHALDALEALLAEHEGEFTTAEHLWPRLDDPTPDVDRRVLRQVVTGALNAGVIEQVGTRYLDGTYHDAQGTPMKWNKIVPVYRLIPSP